MSIYLRDEETGKIMLAKNAQKPKMSNATGETWDWLNKSVNISGEICEVYFDSTWGGYAYFERDDKWYKVNLYHSHDSIDSIAQIRKEFPANYDILERVEELEKVDHNTFEEFRSKY